MLSKDDATLFIRGEDSDNYGECVRGIFDAVSKKEIISRDSVERLVNDLIVTLARVKRENPCEFDTRLTNEIRALRNALQSEPAQWEFYVPVIGFAPSELPFTVGTMFRGFGGGIPIDRFLMSATLDERMLGRHKEPEAKEMHEQRYRKLLKVEE